MLGWAPSPAWVMRDWRSDSAAPALCRSVSSKRSPVGRHEESCAVHAGLLSARAAVLTLLALAGAGDARGLAGACGVLAQPAVSKVAAAVAIAAAVICFFTGCPLQLCCGRPARRRATRWPTVGPYARGHASMTAPCWPLAIDCGAISRRSWPSPWFWRRRPRPLHISGRPATATTPILRPRHTPGRAIRLTNPGSARFPGSRPAAWCK